LTLTGIVASVDGQQVVKDTVAGDALNAEQLGIELAQKMRTQGAQEILEAIFAEQRS
jgi:hydroxymethylbilane synthase